MGNGCPVNKGFQLFFVDAELAAGGVVYAEFHRFQFARLD
jgi:hypothetical protein